MLDYAGTKKTPWLWLVLANSLNILLAITLFRIPVWIGGGAVIFEFLWFDIRDWYHFVLLPWFMLALAIAGVFCWSVRACAIVGGASVATAATIWLMFTGASQFHSNAWYPFLMVLALKAWTVWWLWKDRHISR